MNRYSALVAAIAIIAILVIVLTALALGHNTAMVSLAFAAIGAIVGGGVLYKVGERRGQK